MAERKLKDDSKYVGEVQGNVRHGKGIFYYPNGDKYIGDWENDHFHGQGIYIFHTGE